MRTYIHILFMRTSEEQWTLLIFRAGELHLGTGPIGLIYSIPAFTIAGLNSTVFEAVVSLKKTSIMWVKRSQTIPQIIPNHIGDVYF